MTTLRQRQDQFISDMEMFDNWADKFNYIIERDQNPPEKPEILKEEHRLINCKSNTYFRTELLHSPCGEELVVRCIGWSNSAVLSGLITIICEIFNGTNQQELRETEINFHTKTELIDNLTPLRQDGINEIIRRINKCT